MSEENEFRKPDYEESELFPSGNTPKPLFPQMEPPSVKPLFVNPVEQGAIVRDPMKLEELEIVEVPAPPAPQAPAAPAPESIVEKPSEEPLSYQEKEHAPEIRTPLVVDRSSESAEDPAKIQADPPAVPPAEPVMTEKAPEKTRYEEAKKVPNPVHRCGEVRERFPVVQGGTKEVKKISLAIDLDSASLGTILKEARNRSGLTVQSAAGSSRIKEAYIKALESDNFDLLPKGIFPNAYVRSLCDLYHLDDEARDTALKKVAENLENTDTVPTELLQQIDQNVQRNEQEEKRITKIFYVTVFCAGLLLILIVTGIVMAAVSFRKQPSSTPTAVVKETAEQTDLKRTPPVVIFDTRKLEALTPAQIPCLMQELSVPQK